MANRLFFIISLHACLYHVVYPSRYATFENAGGPEQAKQLVIRSVYPGLISTTRFPGLYSPNTESASRLLEHVIPSQIVSSDPLSTTKGSTLPNSSSSRYQTPIQWPKMPGFSASSFIPGFFQAADYGRRLIGDGLPIGLGPVCGCTRGGSESGRNNFHESVLSDGSECNVLENNSFKNSNEYNDVASGFNGSIRLGNGLDESVSSNFRSGRNFHESVDSGLGINCASVSSKVQAGRPFSRPYVICDVTTNSNSELGRNVAESVSSKSRPDSHLGNSYYSYNGLANSLVNSVSSIGGPGSNLDGPYLGNGLKNCHGSTISNESTNNSVRKGCYGGSGNGAVGVTGQLPVVGRTTVVGQVPISGGVKFDGFIPAAGKVTIGGSCYCGPPFAF